jgi:type IV fimbrial biogenesis protein FimT
LLGHPKRRLLQLNPVRQTAAHSGFTLIELLIALAVFGVLIMLAGPMYAQYMANSQIRNAAESLLDGVRLAQQEAIKQNILAQFVISPTGWVAQVQNEDDPTGTYLSLQSYDKTESAARATLVGHPAGAVTVTFNGLGRVVPNPDATPSLSWVAITNTTVAGTRPLDLVINSTNAGGTSFSGIKLCDPDPGVAAGDSRHCPVLAP